MVGLSLPVSAYDSETFGKDGSFRVDKPIGSASISPCGRDVVLASRQGLHIIDLDSPWSPPRHLPHHTPWEVADVQWSPMAARDYWVVSTSNQKALVWNLSMANSSSSIEHVLHAHTRAITDINFSGFHPDILATCAVDSFVHCWDLRRPARPAMTFCDWFAGATQVKWNRRDSHILASSHDKFLRIWDDRKGAYPLRSIEAHATKIYGVDWSRLETTCLVTCSLDKTIKFWDYQSCNDDPERVIHTQFPVWRARHTPFGSGLLAMPQRGDHDLHLYDRRLDENGQFRESGPVHQFGGHQNQVKEFLWRARGTVAENADHREFQLVSWGTDKLLRLHEVNEDVAASVGYTKGMEVQRTVIFTRRDAKYQTFRDNSSQQDRKLSQDSGLGFQINNEESGHGMHSASCNGMSRSSVPFLGGYGNGGLVSSNVNRTSSLKGMDPISWMQGVKIGRLETSPPGMQKSVSTIMSPGSKTDSKWDQFDSLGEEITSSGAKFPKVAFDEVDVQRRRIVVSFSGPWGIENTSTHIRLSVEFPITYPTASAPIFTLKMSASMTEETGLKLSSEVDIIASSFMSVQRHSLEAVLRYLLGEQSLTESLNWLKQHRRDIIDSTQDTGLSSSDEDDGDLDAPHADALDPMLTVSNAQYNIPLPKTCGALWANNGLLVCFFPVKQERDGFLLDQSLRSIDRPYKSRRTVFEGFGRLRNEPNRQRRGASTLQTIESGESDSEDFESSSSGSTSYSIENAVHCHFMPSITWRSNTIEANQDSSLDESQKSIGENAPASSLAPKPNIFVSLHDLTDLLPSKQKLALGYQIGNTPQVAAHNAIVARDIGDSELGDIWSLIELILQETVSPHTLDRASDDDPITLVVHRALSPLKAKDSAIDLSFDSAEDCSQLAERQPVNWNDHPFGDQWLIRTLFRHFEQEANVQMLAMLSCIFDQSTSRTEKGRDTAMESCNIFHQTRNPPLNSEPSRAVTTSFLRHPPSVFGLNIDVDSHRTSSGPQSATYSNGATASDTLAISSGSGTPPNFRGLRSDMDRKDSRATRSSTSPELQRHGHRAGSSMNTFAPSLPRPLYLNQSAASSPPKGLHRKHHSPAGSHLGSTQTSAIWGPSGFFGRSSTALEDHKSALSFSLSDTDEDMPTSSPPKKPTFTTRLKNQDQFHDEGHASLSLLDPSSEWKYRMYRESYAHMLYVWDMPFARLEMLNQCHSPQNDMQPRGLRKVSAQNTELGQIQRLPIDFVGHCMVCSDLLPIPAVSNKCLKCHKTRAPPICLFCNGFINGLLSPCLNCGHVMHDICRASVVYDGIEECISGCGCRCLEHTSVEMTMPEEKSQLQGQAQAQDQSPALTIIDGFGGVSKQPLFVGEMESPEWENMAYMSLARNLKGEGRGGGGEQGVRARGSQIWRG